MNREGWTATVKRDAVARTVPLARSVARRSALSGILLNGTMPVKCHMDNAASP